MFYRVCGYIYTGSWNPIQYRDVQRMFLNSQGTLHACMGLRALIEQIPYFCRLLTQHIG